VTRENINDIGDPYQAYNSVISVSCDGIDAFHSIGVYSATEALSTLKYS